MAKIKKIYFVLLGMLVILLIAFTYRDMFVSQKAQQFLVVNASLKWEQTVISSEQRLTIIRDFNLTLKISNVGDSGLAFIKVQIYDHFNDLFEGKTISETIFIEKNETIFIHFLFNDREQEYIRKFKVWVGSETFLTPSIFDFRPENVP